MSRKTDYDENKAYIEAENLERLLDFTENLDFKEGAFDAVSGKVNIPAPPESTDLVRLHQLIRKRKSFTILEFGLGYSTLIMADALAKNERDWNNLERKPELRNRYLFQLFSVDTSTEWIDVVKTKMPDDLRNRVHFQLSGVKIGTFQSQICHYYRELPDIVPDFIYLDGPAPKDVEGSINGLSFQCDERTVMSGDLLLMEPIFLPGTFIIVDGRTNNARFLERNFSRNYSVRWSKEEDVTTFELMEDRLGPHNIIGTDLL